MTNFEKKLEEASKEELYSWVNRLDFRVVPLASDELTRRSLNKLQETIENFNRKSSEQTDKMIKLNNMIVVLTMVMLIGIGVQIGLAIQQTNYTEIQSRSERILQSQSIQNSINFCKSSPEAQESGLFDPSNGKPAPCSQVLENYKN